MTNSPDGVVKLEISQAKPSDCGAYKLVISNPNGENAALCAVAVKRMLWYCIKSNSVSDANSLKIPPSFKESENKSFYMFAVIYTLCQKKNTLSKL